MFQTIISIINEALPLIDKLVPDEATRIKNKILSLKERWDAEYSKGSQRNDNNLDLIERELCDIGELFTNAIKSATSQTKP